MSALLKTEDEAAPGTIARPAPLFIIKSSETVPLTRELAIEFADMEPSMCERPFSAARLKYLNERAEANLLVPFNWARVLMDGKMYRGNGQHSAPMVRDLPEEFWPENGTVHLDTYEVFSNDGLAAVFRQFDARQSGRSPGDVAGAYQGLQDVLDPVPPPIGKMAIDGIAWQFQHIECVHAPSGDDRYSLFNREDLHPFIIWLGELFTKKTPELKVTAVIAAMFTTFRANESKAREFWGHVARGGVEYEENDATTILANWLLDAAQKNDPKAAKLKPGNYYQGCIYAWNASRAAKTLKDIRADAGKNKPLLTASE